MPPKQKNAAQEVSLLVTKWIGSLQSVAVHTVAFLMCFVATWVGWLSFEEMLLVLTTVVSLEAIYLAIFIQMTINYTAKSLEGVEQDIDEIQEDVDEIQEDIDEIQEDVDEITEADKEEDTEQEVQQKTLEEIHIGLKKLMKDVEDLQRRA